MEIDLDALLTEALKVQARRNADRKAKTVLRNSKDAAREASEDYAGRLAERAVFRRLLSDSALDAERFRFWFTSSFGSDGRSLEDWRKVIDHLISKEKRRADKV